MRILYLPNVYNQQRQREKKVNIWPVLMAMEATKRRNDGDEVRWNDQRLSAITWADKVITEPEGLPFLSLPHPDRCFTGAFERYYQNNGNFKFHPGTYIQVANGCWHGKCVFCVERGKPYEVRQVGDVISEIEECKALGFKEVFDDSGTLPTGVWLDEFCDRVAKVGIRWGCNMRLVDIDYQRLRSSGCRLVLFGLESANQFTLDTINKGINSEEIITIIKKASKSGLEPHVAVMFGYPWETLEDELKTLNLVKWLLRKGYARTAQASLFTPRDYAPMEERHYLCKRIYEAGLYPDFWINRWDEDVKYLWRGIKSII